MSEIRKENKWPSKRFQNLKKSAKRRDIEVNITLDDWKKLMDETEYKCEYCGEEVKDSSGGSLDRVDNEIGYVEGNLKVCCGNCNHMKRHMDEDEFIKHIRKIFEYSKGA